MKTQIIKHSKPSETVIIKTFLMGLIMLILILVTLNSLHKSILHNNIHGILLQSIIILILLAIYFIPFFKRPRKVILTNKFLIVRCASIQKKILIKDIKTIYPDHNKNIYNFKRDYWGVNGLWGFMGSVKTKHHQYTSYSNNEHEGFIVNLYSGKNYILSCENSKYIIDKINEIEV